MEGMHYLTLVRKSSFIDLYKYGYIFIYEAVNFDGDIDKIKDRKNLFDEITKHIDCFEYSFEYLMLHFTTTSPIEANIAYKLKITDVQKIYVFDDDAKREMEISFNSLFQLHVSDWSEDFLKLHIEKYKEQSLKGIDNIWQIFGINNDEKSKCKQIITDDIVSETFRELFLNERPTGDIPIWVYLLRYERHSSYPRNFKGYFCDMIHIVLNKNNEMELQPYAAEHTHLFREFSSDDFNNLVKTTEKSKKFLTMQQTLVGELPFNCSFHIVATLYLYLRDMYSDGMDCPTMLPGIRPIDLMSLSQYEFDFHVAAYLLGITLGYDKTYERYYRKINLPIFKSKEKDEPAPKTKPKPTSKKSKKRNNPNNELATLVEAPQPEIPVPIETEKLLPQKPKGSNRKKKKTKENDDDNVLNTLDL